MTELIDRFADGDFAADDVVELGALLALDPEARARFDSVMSRERSANDMLGRAAASAENAATRIEPSKLLRSLENKPERPTVAVRPWRIGTYTGWAAAIAIAAIATLAARPPLAPRADGNPDTLLTRYLAEGAAQGRVVGELPQVTLKVSPADGGQGYDVLFVRRLLERTTVEDVYRLGLDEHGHPTFVQGGEPAERESL